MGAACVVHECVFLSRLGMLNICIFIIEELYIQSPTNQYVQVSACK